MYILKYKGQGKQGRNGAKNPRSILHSSQAQSLCFWSWFSLFSYFIIMPCRASLSLLFFVQSSQSTLQRIDSWPEVSYWREQHPAQDPLRSHWGCVSPGRVYDVSVRNITVLYVCCTNHQPTTLGHHAMLRLMSNSEILQTSLDTRKEDKHSLFLKNEMSMKGCFLRIKCL